MNIFLCRCAFSTNESCQDWFKRIYGKITPPKELSDVFAFAFYAWCLDCSPSAAELEGCYQLCQIGRYWNMCGGFSILLFCPALVSVPSG